MEVNATAKYIRIAPRKLCGKGIAQRGCQC